MPSDVRIGTSVAGFRLESLVGEGAMGTVFLAADDGGRRVALKILPAELARDDRFRRRFLRESQLAAALDHPRIVPVLDSGEAEGVLYLAMAYVEGSDLRAVLRREGALEPARAVDLVGQVAEGLDAAHAAGLVHRDVKPGNILVADEEDGREAAYVCDFGLARHVSSVGSLTGDRGFVGTVDYVPPEQIEGGTIDRRADVYSLGCVLYECLAGERPFDRDSELAVVFAHLNEAPPQLSETRPTLPDAFDDVVATALAKSPDDRHATCGELAAAAAAALRGRKARRRRLGRRRRLLASLAVAGAAIAAGAAGLLALGDEEAAAPPRERERHLAITQSTIAGVPLGLSVEEYKDRLGLGWREDRLKYPEGYSLLIHHPAKVAAYFKGAVDKAVELTTWNRDFRTAAGVGPCSTVAQLKRVYGDALKPSPWNTQNGNVYGYTVGKNLFFAVDNDLVHVNAVALYSARAIGFRALAYASYIALNETHCT